MLFGNKQRHWNPPDSKTSKSAGTDHCLIDSLDAMAQLGQKETDSHISKSAIVQTGQENQLLYLKMKVVTTFLYRLLVSILKDLSVLI